MNELEKQEFDYSLVDNEIANKLKEYDEQLNRLYNNYTIEVGEILYNANKEFSNPKDGTFIKWVEYKGFKRQSAYNYMNVYKAFQNLESIDDQKNFLSQPKTLQYEMSKPSTNKEVNQAVLNGEIKSSKEYKDLERQLKQRDEQNAELQSQVEQAQRSEEIARKQLEDEQNREPEVIEKYIEPEDYQQTKDALDQSRHQQRLIQQRNEKLEKDIKEMELRRDEVSEKSQKYDELNKALGDMNRKLDDGQRRLKAQKEVYDLVKKGEALIKEIAPMTYFIHDEYILSNEYAIKPIKKIADDLLDLSKKLNQQLNKGDVIDV
ncbi:hypothetical protein BUY59_10915 [Staphylococcus epidermidis]|uniref:hypothetical protein n=1 Tax=Staphylococcus epidermidis TaxID=1282 RepID=UPI000E67B914|nr:hypothetical protein [Staphylococcus epidermidis]RIL63844.1 hypothetical protein BUY59_10915 [Staphylococcus epidermidis]